jgi:DNA invertase Pin-like site-specific DNA recombinase
MGAFAEFERSLIKERQKEGIALAKKRGAYKGRKPALSKEKVEEIKDRVAHGDKKTILLVILVLVVKFFINIYV